MSQEKAAEIIDFSASRGEGGPDGAVAQGPGASPVRETAGAFLAAARRDAGLSLAAISDVIKVKISHLEAIEATRPDLLPAAPYATGFVKAYARALGLDAEELARQFREDIGAAAPAQLVFADPAPAVDPGAALLGGARLISIFAVIAVVAFVFWITSQILSGGDEPEVLVAAGEPAPRASAVPPFTPSEGAASDPAASDAAAAVEDAALADPGAEAGSPAAPLPRVKPAVVVAALASSVQPAYPEACAEGAGLLETVTVLFDITADGRPQNARVIASSNACFEDAALAALTQWRFTPRTVGGAPAVAAGKRATLNFRG